MNRQDALVKCKAIRDYLTAGNPVWSKEEVAEAMTMAIEALENERPKGHWDFVGNNLFRCTECGVLYDYSQLEQLKIYITDSTFPSYCPRCGADTKGARND